jgi:muramoyltetrapeptide carboxypeptidase LdcA involved in peptidoglycan recycling
MISQPIYPPKPKPGDRVAIVSPSAGLPERFPRPFDVGLARLRDEFGLIPVEYPTTRKLGAHPADRAADLHAAFADPDIKAVITSIGGDDEIRVLPYLDPELIKANPKPFFGYSDNTCLLAYLWSLGLVGYHGGCVMVQYGRPGRMHPITEASIRAALFDSGEFELTEVSAYGDEDSDWDDPVTFEAEPAMQPCDGWVWHNHAGRVAEGVSWGGNIEILSWLLMTGRAIPDAEHCRGGILFLETSEELPAGIEVYRILRAMGERGLLSQFFAVLFARPKAWALDRRTTPDQKLAYRAGLHDAVLQALAEYAPDAMAVLDVDFGHADPQQVIPHGGLIRIDAPTHRITVHY